ncbi:Phosphoserine phosphatase SerB [Paragonimus heterotremus]|uniref:Phosphoserine phosphatase n=1 Tax=Paragonimus heterotremus TaxID=100268 RepID=A0A8J4WHN2_9TREM|nr:Phosphoserine phosphatase SerB [Paragonimus heterotremus]
MSKDSQVWSSIGCVCFDVDSTVCTDEGIDELAHFLGHLADVEHITVRAMNGELDFTRALALRLSIIRPSSAEITSFLSVKKPSLTPGIRNLIFRLQRNNIHVCLVSGGLLPIVHTVADALNVSLKNVYANKLIFAEDGSYLNFDHDEPTCRSDGKAKVVADLMRRFNTDVVMIGDGMTDCNACPPARFFIGFGGNVERPVVRAATDYFYTKMDDIVELFERVGLLKA